MSDTLAEAQEKTRLHDYAGAETLYTQYLENKDDPAVREKLGSVQLKQKKYYEAIETFSEVCEAVPENAEYFAELADALVYVHRFNDAMDMYMRAAQISGSHKYQLKAGEMNIYLGNPDAALALYQLILSAHKEDPDVYAAIAEAQDSKALYKDANVTRLKELALRKSLAESAPSAESWAACANLQAKTGNWHEAKKCFEESLALADSPKVRLGYAETLTKLGDSAAEREFEAAADADPLDFAMLNEIGDTLTRLENYNLAIQMYTKALALRNVNADTWVSIAYALYKSGNTEDAQAFYEMAKASAAVREMPWADKMHKSEKTEELDKVF